jgi:hypothetical protein
MKLLYTTLVDKVMQTFGIFSFRAKGRVDNSFPKKL